MGITKFKFEILKNTGRYSNLKSYKDLPNRITCEGTIEQAKELAFRLSNWEPGCDYCFYVEGDEDV